MAKNRKVPQSDVPEGYTPEQWAEYQADPVGFCIKELNNKDSDVRFNAVDILRGCAGDAKAAIPTLCDLLGKEKVATIRAQIAWALQDICVRVDARSAKQAVGPLTKALHDSDAEVRSLAAKALGAIGKPAKGAKPNLEGALKDPTEDVRKDKMPLSARAKKLAAEFTRADVKLGDLKKRGAEIKKDHELAMELWSTGQYYPRLLATLIFDKKLLAENVIDQLAADMLRHDAKERCQLADWLMANQLAKDKKLASQMTTWEKNPSPILRRWFWYHQARLRWVGQAPPGNSAALLDSLEKGLAKAEPEVQWAMNFCAGQIGIHESKFRSRCIKLGESLGLYKDEHVAKNCTPSYLPEFIRIEVAKRA